MLTLLISMLLWCSFASSAPCPPTQVSIQSSCDSDTVSVSWQTSQGSVSYMAVAESSGGHRTTCNTSLLTCDITGLQCGQTYQIYVSGVDGDCIGSRSEVRILETGENYSHCLRSFAISNAAKNLSDHLRNCMATPLQPLKHPPILTMSYAQAILTI